LKNINDNQSTKFENSDDEEEEEEEELNGIILI
jgi:hypothetical protein